MAVRIRLDLGEAHAAYDDARRWWATARSAADAPTDVDLAAWLADAARAKALARSSVGLLYAMGVQS